LAELLFDNEIGNARLLAHHADDISEKERDPDRLRSGPGSLSRWLRLAPERRQQDDDRQRNPDQPKQRARPGSSKIRPNRRPAAKNRI
jgi:hypothetical protein